MPAARLLAPHSAPRSWNAREHSRGVRGPALPPPQPWRSRAHPLAGSPGPWLRDASWGGTRGRGVTEGPRSAPPLPRAPGGQRAQGGGGDAGAPAHLISWAAGCGGRPGRWPKGAGAREGRWHRRGAAVGWRAGTERGALPAVPVGVAPLAGRGPKATFGSAGLCWLWVRTATERAGPRAWRPA